jgi:hypothetical protein
MNVAPGDTLPDYELPDHERVTRKLSEIQGDDPMILTLARGYWFWGRPSFYDLWQDLRDVSREIRPDWDLSAPGLREDWDSGDMSPFHGWNKPGWNVPVAS